MEKPDMTILDFYDIFWNKKKFIITFTLLITSISLILCFFLPKWYKAESTILSPQTVANSPLSSLSLLSDLGMGPLMKSNEQLLKYIAILRSRALHEKVINRFNLKERYHCINMEETLKKFDKNLKYKIGDEFQVKIEFFDKNQDEVAIITDYIVKSLDSLNICLSVSNARSNREFLELRVNEMLDSLEFTGDELAYFMKHNKIISLEDQVKAGVEQAAMIKSLLIQKQVELDVSNNVYGKDNPKSKEILTELKSLNTKYDELQNNTSLDKIIPNFDKVPALELSLMKLKRKYEYYTKVMEFLGPQFEQQRFEEAKNTPTLQILDKAVRPARKAKPKYSFILMSTFIGSFLLSIFLVGISKKVSYYKQIQMNSIK